MSRNKRRSRRVNQKTLLVTVDIGKKTNHGYFRTPQGDDIKPFPVPNTREGFEGFWSKIVNARERHGLEEVLFGFESSGPYAEPLTHFMKAKGAKLVQVNPMHTKRLKELTDNSPEKSDKKDPRVIADVIVLGRGLSVIIPTGFEADLRRLTQARENLSSHRTMLYNKIHERLSLVFPEYDNILDPKTKTAAWVFMNYPTPEKIVVGGLDELHKNIRKISRGKIRSEKIKTLFSAAENSVGIREGLRGFELEIKLLYEHVIVLDKSLAEIEHEIAEILGKIPYSRNLLSIKGIGDVTAAALIGEIGDMKKFSSVKDVIKLAGLNLYTVSSGKHVGKNRITKRGRNLLRKTLYFAVLSMVRKGGIFHKDYNSYLRSGKHKKVALTILARKLLKIVFALVRDDVVYDPDANKEKSEDKAA